MFFISGRTVIGIVDIAKQCNVTPSTVSRALNGKVGVSDSLRNKILTVSKELGYEPNNVARSLVTNDSKLIGLILPDITSPYYACIAKGVDSYLRAQGYGVMLCNSSRDKSVEKECLRLLQAQRISGLIIVSVTVDEDDLLNLSHQGIRVVAADIAIGPHFSSVVNDHYNGALTLFKHMIKCGCRKIGCILGSPSSSSTQERLRALRQVLEENDIDFDKNNVVYADATFENGYKKAKTLLQRDIDTIFAINDTVALGAMKYCQDHGIKIPQDIKIAGYDDLEVASMIAVPLTTVHQRKVLLGRKAAELLLHEIKTPSEPIKIVLSPSLMIRESCGESLLK